MASATGFDTLYLIKYGEGPGILVPRPTNNTYEVRATWISTNVNGLRLTCIQSLLETLRVEMPTLGDAPIKIVTEAIPYFNGQSAVVDARSFPRIAAFVNTYLVSKISVDGEYTSRYGLHITCLDLHISLPALEHGVRNRDSSCQCHLRNPSGPASTSPSHQKSGSSSAAWTQECR